MVTDILNAELTSQGLEVNTHLCEHFSYSRQELFQIIKINRIKRYGDLLARYGQGQRLRDLQTRSRLYLS